MALINTVNSATIVNNVNNENNAYSFDTPGERRQLQQAGEIRRPPRGYQAAEAKFWMIG